MTEDQRLSKNFSEIQKSEVNEFILKTGLFSNNMIK